MTPLARARFARHVLATRLRYRQGLRYLARAGAGEMRHSRASLLRHLVRTSALLRSWGAPPHVCAAALFHSVYGTERFTRTLLSADARNEVRALIGAEAEALAWLWCALKRESLEAALHEDPPRSLAALDGSPLPATHAQVLDLANLLVANAVEQTPRESAEKREKQRQRLAPFLGAVLPSAAAAARDLLGELAVPC